MDTERRLIQDTVDEFKKYLPYLRIACGYSQTVMADILELSHPTYNHIESGLEPMKMRDYFAIRYIIEEDEFGKLLTSILVNGNYLTAQDKARLIRQFDRVLKKASRKSGMPLIKNSLIRTYNEFILEKKAGEKL